MVFVKVSSCEIFRPKANRLRSYSVAESKLVFPRNPIFRAARVFVTLDLKTFYWKPTKYLYNAKIRSKIGQAVPELLPKNVTNFREKVTTITSEIGTNVVFFVLLPSSI